MPIADLSGVRLKLERAQHHLSDLNTAVQTWAAAEYENNSLMMYPDYERKRIDVVIGEVEQGDPQWSAILGDAVHNMRSALDHLVCQLAIKNGNLVTCCDSTYFPICIDGRSWRNAKRNIEDLVHPDALALIQRLQPYKAAQSGTANPGGRDPVHSNLWIVSQLDIIDKHRILVVVRNYLGKAKFVYTINDRPSVHLPVEACWRPLENGTEIASIDLSGETLNREDKVRVQMEAEAKIFFNDTGCCDGLKVDEALDPCLRHVTAIVDEFEARFFSK